MDNRKRNGTRAHDLATRLYAKSKHSADVSHPGLSTKSGFVQEARVVYLARAGNHPSALERFLNSWRRYPAGIDWDFVIVFKGFKRREETRDYQAIAHHFKAEYLWMQDVGFDLRAYYLVMNRFENPYFCFFNSFSEILAENWLEKLVAPLRSGLVGLAGATGSYESMFTNVQIQRSRFGNRSFATRLWTPFRLVLCRACFQPFPNYHLRTNAFAISKELMRRVWPRLRLTKRGAYLFENGRHSLTQRVLKLGLKPVVVDKYGRTWLPEAWPQSNTFRNGNQEHLLAADNQTREYAEADAMRKDYLREITWGWGSENHRQA